MEQKPDFSYLLDGVPYKGIAFRGNRFEDERFLLRREKMPGIFFSSDADYASAFGDFIHECEVVLDNPHVGRHDDGNTREFILDREKLIELGYDGLIMIYEKDFFVVPLHAEQVRHIRVTRKQEIQWEETDNEAASPSFA